jgi:hypothetical protein
MDRMTTRSGWYRPHPSFAWRNLLPCEKLLKRRMKASFDAHRRRAALDRQQLEYGLDDLMSLVQSADRCCYCGAVLTPATIALDHKMPTCRTGDYGLGNLAVCCGDCQLRKGLLNAGEYRSLLDLLAGWHPRAARDVLARLKAGGSIYRGGQC